jgi:gamma-tubulin complex component 4
MHTSYLSFLREGLLLSDTQCPLVIRNILETCERFVGLVERWGGDVLPELLMEGASGEKQGEMVKDRSDTVQEINEVGFQFDAVAASDSSSPQTLHSLLDEFFQTLIESQAPASTHGDLSSSRAAGSASISHTARAFQQLQSTKLAHASQRNASRMNGVFSAGTKGKKDEKETLAEASMSRHVEQRESSYGNADIPADIGQSCCDSILTNITPDARQ